MFDIGFSELLLFGVIALIVLGPEKLPQAARTAGQWYAKIRRTVSTLQSEIEAELDLAETRQLMQKELAKIRQTEAEMRREMAEMRGNMKEFEQAQNQNLHTAHDTTDKLAYSEPAESNTDQNKRDDDRSKQSSDQSNEQTGEQSKNRPSTPKEFDYHYEKFEQNKQSKVSSNNLKSDANDTSEATVQVAQIISTKPWENMWFSLGAYDKARRLPAAPYLANYKADILLNSGLDNFLDSPLNTQTSVNQQESK